MQRVRIMMIVGALLLFAGILMTGQPEAPDEYFCAQESITRWVDLDEGLKEARLCMEWDSLEG